MSRRKRIAMALIMAPAAIVALLFLPSPLLAGLVAVVMMAGLWEWTQLADLNERLARVAYLAANALLMAAIAWGAGPGGWFVFKLISVVGAFWWLLVLLWLARFDFAADHSARSRAIKLLAGSLSVIPAWAALCWLHADGPLGPRWALFAVGLVWAADTGAYFVGVRYGKRKLAARISPGKSWEGVFGGLLLSLLLTVSVLHALDLPWSALPELCLLTLIVTFISIVGDLFESLLKRHSGIKDSSHLIPGHGGILDRLDSMLAALPVFVVVKFWLSL